MKRSCFENLDEQLVREIKIFWKKIAILFSNKIKSRESHLMKTRISFQTTKKLLKPFANSLVML